MVIVIDDDGVMAGCVAKAVREAGAEVRVFSDAIAAMNMISEGVVPEMIFLDVMLTGPDGFTFLNELISYDDTAKIPVVIVTALDLTGKDLGSYGVVAVLEKEVMVPRDIRELVEEYRDEVGASGIAETGVGNEIGA